MTNEEQNELAQKESKRLWENRVFKWLIFGLVIFLLIIIVNSIVLARH